MEINRINCKNAPITVEETGNELIVRNRNTKQVLFSYDFFQSEETQNQPDYIDFLDLPWHDIIPEFFKDELKEIDESAKKLINAIEKSSHIFVFWERDYARVKYEFELYNNGDEFVFNPKLGLKRALASYGFMVNCVNINIPFMGYWDFETMNDYLFDAISDYACGHNTKTALGEFVSLLLDEVLVKIEPEFVRYWNSVNELYKIHKKIVKGRFDLSPFEKFTDIKLSRLSAENKSELSEILTENLAEYINDEFAILWSE